MEQQPIRDYNGQRYTKEEGAAIIKELDDRTKYDDPNYNSMQSIGEKMQIVKERIDAANFESVIVYTTLVEAKAVTPIPEDGTLFQVSQVTDNENKGFWSYQSGEIGGVRFEREFNPFLEKSYALVEGDNQPTTTATASNSAPTTVHGVSAGVGVFIFPFNKVTVGFGQKSTEIDKPTQLEVRLLKNNAAGELVTKKRVSFAPQSGTQASVVVEFDEVISTSERLWIQILVNNPFAYKFVNPGTIFTAGNGWDPIKATTINDLDGTVFSTSQGYFDIFVTFNSLIEDVNRKFEDDFDDLLNEKIATAKNIRFTPLKSWNAVGHSIWWQDGVVYNGTSDVAIGVQTHVRNAIPFSNYRNYGYSGHSLGGLTSGDTSSILKSSIVSTWIDADIWTLDTITNDFKREIPLGSTSDFLNNTGKTTYYGALREFHEVVRALSPNCIIIASNALQRSTAGYSSFDANSLGHTLKDYEAALLYVCERLSWRFVDQFRNSGINIDNIAINTLDGLHPNDVGYSIYAGLWLSEFKKVYAK
tara:strand:- start:658 stop:2250 length:1593 start_codon:yes stop_codon:yes gene_type:complete